MSAPYFSSIPLDRLFKEKSIPLLNAIPRSPVDNACCSASSPREAMETPAISPEWRIRKRNSGPELVIGYLKCQNLPLVARTCLGNSRDEAGILVRRCVPLIKAQIKCHSMQRPRSHHLESCATANRAWPQAGKLDILIPISR